MIESVRIRGFRSLANVELSEIPKAAVLIGANGSGKSNFIRFFEMLSWMLGSRRLAEFVEMQG
ncbi:MAG: AAA family ATPase, partial [Gemmatimonadetes bacterium]|nr:AAA family ATPase [Gemmatimonadota bacterium]